MSGCPIIMGGKALNVCLCVYVCVRVKEEQGKGVVDGCYL